MKQGIRLALVVAGLGAGVYFASKNPPTAIEPLRPDSAWFTPRESVNISECAVRSGMESDAKEYMRRVSGYEANAGKDLSRPLIPGDSVMLPVYNGLLCGESR
jgi:hypothetical protein